MTISQLHASHIREVNVGFIISGPKVDPEQLSDLTHIPPDRSARKGDERRNARGDLLGSDGVGPRQVFDMEPKNAKWTP
jgi:hypothetical protein